MWRWGGLDELPEDLGPSVVSVGVFDGVHRGHAAVLGRAVESAQRLGASPVVVTFDPHPVEVIRPGVHVPRLATVDRRVDLLGELGVQGVLVLPFTTATAAEPAEQFVSDVLVAGLGVRAVVVGEDFRFGRGATGDVALLAELGAAHGFETTPVAPVGESGERWSSTRIRDAIAAGQVGEAERMLGRPHRLEGAVVRGEQRGRALGFPTANVEVRGGLAIPGDGVYAGWLEVGGERLPTALSVGTNPTFEGQQRTVEAYVLDRDDLDLYDQVVSLDLVARLRGMERFAAIPELKAAMARDVEQARFLLT
ncbi:MAG: riboflavin kinase / adenylyltransferase [Frankiales bacterium]|nr:riboflavin kinase / adenylyltransferase [Frankiales bacterium]